MSPSFNFFGQPPRARRGFEPTDRIEPTIPNDNDSEQAPPEDSEQVQSTVPYDTVPVPPTALPASTNGTPIVLNGGYNDLESTWAKNTSPTGVAKSPRGILRKLIGRVQGVTARLIGKTRPGGVSVEEYNALVAKNEELQATNDVLRLDNRMLGEQNNNVNRLVEDIINKDLPPPQPAQVVHPEEIIALHNQIGDLKNENYDLKNQVARFADHVATVPGALLETSPDAEALRRIKDLEEKIAAAIAAKNVAEAVAADTAELLGIEVRENDRLQQELKNQKFRAEILEQTMNNNADLAAEAEARARAAESKLAEGGTDTAAKKGEVIEGEGIVTVVSNGEQPESPSRDMVAVGIAPTHAESAVDAVEKKSSWQKPVFNEEVERKALEGSDLTRFANTLTLLITTSQEELGVQLRNSSPAQNESSLLVGKNTENNSSKNGTNPQEVTKRFESLSQEERNELVSPVPPIPQDADEETLLKHVLNLKRRTNEIMSLLGSTTPISHAFEEVERKALEGSDISFTEKALTGIKARAMEARDGIKKARLHMLAIYNKHPVASRAAFSGVLIGASIFMPAGSAALVAGKVGLRALGSYEAGKTVERVLRARIGRKTDGAPLTRKQEREIRDSKYAAMIAAFALGSILDVLNFYGVGGQVSPAGTMASGQVTVEVPVEVPAIVEPPVMADLPIPEISVDNIGTTLVSEVIVKPGDTLSHIIMNNGLSEMMSPEQLEKLSTVGKQNFITNIVERLSPDQLKDIGISSGNLRSIQVGEHIDIKKLAEFVKDMSVTVTEEGAPSKITLLKRALGL